jgi:hypothetical protein
MTCKSGILSPPIYVNQFPTPSPGHRPDYWGIDAPMINPITRKTLLPNWILLGVFCFVVVVRGTPQERGGDCVVDFQIIPDKMMYS